MEKGSKLLSVTRVLQEYAEVIAVTSAQLLPGQVWKGFDISSHGPSRRVN